MCGDGEHRVMSTTAAGGDLTPKQHRILEYLRTEADERTYFKSRLMAEDLDMTAKEVGANMTALLRADTDLSIEKWGYSSGTTWRVVQTD